VSHDALVRMKKAAKKLGVKLKEAESYVPALDKDGKQIRNQDGKKLYTSPNGELITKKQIPPLKKHVACEWTLSSGAPLYFAFGDLPDKAWARELSPDKCSLNLVFDDVVPRIPECPELNEAGFGVKRGKSPDQVVISVTVDNQTSSAEIPFGRVGMVTAGKRVVVWVRASKIEEGAYLTIDSLVLDPANQGRK
jgi:hypothetical protein